MHDVCLLCVCFMPYLLCFHKLLVGESGTISAQSIHAVVALATLHGLFFFTMTPRNVVKSRRKRGKMFPAVGSDRGRSVFTPEAKCTGVWLEVDRDHLRKRVRGRRWRMVWESNLIRVWISIFKVIHWHLKITVHIISLPKAQLI